MFQCFSVFYFRRLLHQRGFFSFSRFHYLLILGLAFSQCNGLTASEVSAPVWTVPTKLISDDGYALLDWEIPEEATAQFFRITEEFKGKEKIHYVETSRLKARRLLPGNYNFTLQACVKGISDRPDCGEPSMVLTMKVSNALTDSLLTGDTADPLPDASAEPLDGGPADLRPGDWYNPAKDGHGWNFFWANRLALSKNDPLFGNSYDLVGIWYTFEAKSARVDPECLGCPPVPDAYRPVVLNLKAVRTGPGTYGGSLFVSQVNGRDIWVGAAEVVFGSDNSSATINWSANFKKEFLSDSDPLIFLHGSNPADINNISHFSGLWERSGSDDYYIVSDIGSTAELIFVVFHDDAGDPTWIHAANFKAPYAGLTSFCLSYLTDGYSPQSNKPFGWKQTWHMSGCNSSNPATSLNRNGRRYFTALHRQLLSAAFTLPGTTYSRGSVSIGSSSSTQALIKAANFHAVSFDTSSGTSCELISSTALCGVLLTWFTDGNYPDATVYAHNRTTGNYTRVATSTTPVMNDVAFSISDGGVYEFELRMGDSLQSTLLADSAYFTVTENFTNAPPILTTPQNQEDDTGASIELILNASDPDVGDVLSYSAAGLPAGLVLDAATGRISGTLSASAAEYTVVATVRDNHGNSDSKQFIWTVNAVPVNNAPTITNPGQQIVVQNSFINLSLAVDDVDNDPLNCSTDGSLPSGLSVKINTSNSGCIVSGMLQENAGSYLSKIIVTDIKGATAQTSISWNVLTAGGNPETPPPPIAMPNMNASYSSSRIGTTPAEFRVDESGSATYTIPILTAPASGGLQPQIALNYSSRGGNGDVGVGWSIGGVSMISRCPQTMEQDGIEGSRAVNLDREDRFCLDGQRLIKDPSSGAYGANGTLYALEIDNFSRITSYGSAGNGPAWFKVEHKDGSEILYGKTADSRIETRGGANSATVLTWAQNRVEDRFGNYMLFSYLEKSSGAVGFALKEIKYSGNIRSGTQPSARLEFNYSDRSDVSDLTQFYAGGVKLEQSSLLQSIRSRGRIVAGSSWQDLRFYDLAYEEDGVGRKILKTMTECRSSSKTTCFKPTRFDWIKSENRIETTGKVLNGLLPKSSLSGLIMGDVSGDGRPDLMYTQRISKRFFLKVKTATSNATFNEWPTRYELRRKADGQAPKLFSVDINADGLQDVVYSKYASVSNDYSWVALISTGSSFLNEIELNPAYRYFLNDQNLESRFRIMDFNGDGLSDILHAHTNATGDVWRLSILLNEFSANDGVRLSPPITVELDNADLFPSDNKDGWEMSTRPPFYKWGISGVGADNHPDARVFDFNGDGAVDLLLKVWRKYEKCIKNCIQTAPGTGGNGGGQGGNAYESVYQVEFASFWVLMESDGHNRFKRQNILALGENCNVPAVCDAPSYQGLPNTSSMRPVDINGDGLTDLAWGDSGNQWYFQINTGRGFEEARLIGQVASQVDELVRFEDWNGDAYPDLIYPSARLDANATWMIYQNHFGRAFAAATDSDLKSGNVGGNVNLDEVENDASVFADFDGDGKLDQLLIDHDTSAQIISSRIYEGMNVSGSRATAPANVITRITNGLGAIHIISYKPLTNSSVYSRMYDSSGAWWGNGSAVYDLTVPIYVVSQVSKTAPVYNALAARSQIQYHYVGAKLQAGGRGFLGFGEVISYNPQSKIRTNTRYRQDFPFIGMPADFMQAANASGSKFGRLSKVSANKPIYWGSVTASTPAAPSPGGTLLRYSINEWVAKSRVTGTVFPLITDTLERKNTLSGVFDRKQRTSSSYDMDGNLTYSKMRTYASNGSTTFSTQTTVNVYWPADPGNWYLGRLKKSAVTNSRAGASTVTRKSAFEYDNATGALNKQTSDPSHSKLEVITSYGLDNFGNRISTSITGKNMGTRTQRTTYESLGRIAIVSKNALGQTTQRVNTWDVFGNSLVSTNIDGVKTTSAADHMGRPYISYTETGVWNRTLNYKGAGSYCPSGTVYRTVAMGGGVNTQQNCFDKLEREMRTAIKRLDGRYAFTDQYFDSSNRIARVSEPYFAGATRYWNQTTYDDIGRVTTVLSAGGDDIIRRYDNQAGNSCTASGAGVILTTNGLGQEHVEIKNALDETVAVYDDNCGLVTTVYDAAGNLKIVAGVDGETVSMNYDLAGRKISMNDPDKGYWQYSYNALGEISRQLDSKGQAVDFDYDALGRITQRRELKNVSSLTDASYSTLNRESTVYKSSGKGKGQIGTFIYRSGESGAVLHKKSVTYDNFGRVDIVSTTINGNVYAEQTTYDAFSRVFQQFDASGGDRGLRYIYSNGYVSKIKEAREGTNGVIYKYHQTMDARGNVTMARLGNGVSVFASYEQNSGRLRNLSASDALGVEIQDVDYLFDVLGNLKNRNDHSSGSELNEIFSYDQVNRLKSVNLSVNGGVPKQTLSLNYDISGNISYKSDVGSYQYNGPQPHAVSRAGGTNYSYDTNGNQTAGGGRAINYTVFDKPGRIARGVSLIRFFYGVGNGRYQRKDYEGGILQKSTVYLGSVERITENGDTYFRRYLGGVAIANYYPSSGANQLSYLLKDHLNSIHSMLDNSGLITASMHFGAFGERQRTDWQTPLTSFRYAPLNQITTRGFTGHEQVDPVGVIHMNGRIYDPRLGRFLQADAVVQTPKNGQSLNRYSYVLNNPLSYTDPSGYFSLKSFFKKWGRVIVAVVASYFTFGAASAWAFGMMPSVAAGVATTAAYTASAVIGGAIAGFVGGAIVQGNIKGALRGAFLGAAFAYVGAQVKIGIQNWRNGRGEVWHVKYDEALHEFVPKHISDPTIVQIDQLFVNGQSNQLGRAMELGFEQLGQPDEFFLFHNPTHGFIADTVESTLGKFTNTSSISRQLAGILKGQAGSLTNLTAHSQGGIIASNAFRQLSNKPLTVNTVVNFNGAAVGPNIFSKTVLRSGATPGLYGAHAFDAIPNIFGMATYNPFKILGSILFSPLLITPLSQHSVYAP